MLLITCFIFGLFGSLTWAESHSRNACPSGTFANKDRSQWYCYKFYEDRLTFQEAEVQCQYKWKGHLASFKLHKQAKSVGAYVNEENTEENTRSDFVWIGLQQHEGFSGITGWGWIDGSRSMYRKWNYGQPTNKSYKELCAALLRSSGYLTWVDLDCNHKLPFLCKWKPS